MPSTMYQDDSGNESSFRINWSKFINIIRWILFVLLGLTIWESTKESPDYTGLATLFTAVMGSGAVTYIAKAYQKKYEK